MLTDPSTGPRLAAVWIHRTDRPGNRAAVVARREFRGPGSVRDGNLWRELLATRYGRLVLGLLLGEGRGEGNERTLIRNRRGLCYCRASGFACFSFPLSLSLSLFLSSRLFSPSWSSLITDNVNPCSVSCSVRR